MTGTPSPRPPSRSQSPDKSKGELQEKEPDIPMTKISVVINHFFASLYSVLERLSQPA